MSDTALKAGEKTSDYYRTHNLPERFNQPVAKNIGNPVFTFEGTIATENSREDCFRGYGSKNEHPMYRTATSSYGSHAPNVHTVPTSFHGRSQKFSEHLGKSGMYRNHSLNTSSDKSKV
ncbi:piercer of microtubule wall 1 protein-like [Oscarella lobularis]|uniref:piercer of microtubule wall 1 protein-like n=1 Tax=Oscarella lobularis TaxID=121494 RepID=UPI003313F0AA